MKSFEIPSYYRSPIISRVKALRAGLDKRKQDFSPTVLYFGETELVLARHFGFCFGVENAIEISYKAIEENPGKRIYLLSQMIHNPGVNGDLERNGIRFIQDTMGNQLIPWDALSKDDVVIIPAFGTTLEIEDRIKSIGIDALKYDTTCPFVQRVWKKSEKLGADDHTVIIHGKDKHEETRATFSHTKAHAHSIVIRDLSEAVLLGEIILGKRSAKEFYKLFQGRFTDDFNPETDLDKIGVVNQTTMLADETQEISDYLYSVMKEKYGDEADQHFANTRDTLCYATNDNQSATKALIETEADLAIVVGGYNSSNTSHLVELCEEKFATYFIRDEDELLNADLIRHYDLHAKAEKESAGYLPAKRPLRIILTSGASCPDATVDRVIRKLIGFIEGGVNIEETILNYETRLKNGI